MGTDNFEDLVKCGYLEMKLPRKHRKFGRQVWKRKWFILRRKSNQGNLRLEYHKSEESCMTVQNKTVVDLKSMVKIESCKSKSRTISFKLTFNDTFIILSTDNPNAMKEWVKMIKKLVLPPEPIYQPRLTTGAGSFPVTVINTKDSEFLKIAGDCLLVVNIQHLSLYKLDIHMRASKLPIAKWDLDDIPRFRLQKLNQLNDAEKIFIINLARRGQGAENELQFLTLNGREILETVKQNTRQRTRLIDESPRSTPVNDDRDATESSSSFGGFNDSRSRSCSGRSQTARSEVSTTSTVHSEKYSDELSNESESESDVTLRDQPLKASLLVH
eukprot:TCONS_00055192-protein